MNILWRIIQEFIKSKLYNDQLDVRDYYDDIIAARKSICDLFPDTYHQDKTQDHVFCWVRMNKITKRISFHFQFIVNKTTVCINDVGSCYQIEYNNTSTTVKKGEIKQIQVQDQMLRLC